MTLTIEYLESAAMFIDLTFDVKLMFAFNGESEADMATEEIVLDLSEVTSEAEFWSLVYHEVAHIICLRKGKYKRYHSPCTPKKYMLRYGLRVERYVDSIGEKLMNQYHPELQYVSFYRKTEDVEFYKNYIEKEY